MVRTRALSATTAPPDDPQRGDPVRRTAQRVAARHRRPRRRRRSSPSVPRAPFVWTPSGTGAPFVSGLRPRIPPRVYRGVAANPSPQMPHPPRPWTSPPRRGRPAPADPRRRPRTRAYRRGRLFVNIPTFKITVFAPKEYCSFCASRRCASEWCRITRYTPQKVSNHKGRRGKSVWG